MDPTRWERTEELFLAALDLPSEERHRYLEEACPDDPELRSRVRNLLSDHEGDPDFMETPVARVADLGDELEDTPNAARHIGPYRLVRVLGRGGVGEVYLAVQEGDGFQRSVALKVIRPGMDTQAVLERFRLERSILAGLKHPNIAQLLDGGVTDDNRPYVVMEYVEGVPLDEYCDEKRLSVRDRVVLFRSVCEAVQHAHQNLTLHRDLKPGNILVTPDGTPKLLDFGIAKLLTPDMADQRATHTALRMLTPEYAAPEQITGDTVSVATDVYGLAVLLFELLTGRRPHEGSSDSWGAVERAVTTAGAPRPSQVINDAEAAGTRMSDLRRLKRDLSGDLDTIVLKALHLEPHRRYASVSAFSGDLGRYLDGLPVHARPDTLWYRTSKFARRNALPLGAVAAVFITLASATVYSVDQSQKASAERDEALEVRGFLLEMFGATGPDQSTGDTVTARQLLDRQAEALTVTYGDQPELRAEMMIVLAEGYDRLGLLGAADSLATSALALRRGELGPTHPDVGAALGLLGWIRHESGSSGGGETLLREAVAILRSAGGHERELSRVLNDLGVIREAAGDYDDAEALYLEAMELRRHVFGEGHRSFAVTASNLSVIRYRNVDYAGAVAAATDALAAMRKAVGPDHQRSILIQNNLAAMRIALGDNKGAAVEYRNLLERQERLQGSDHPTTIVVLRSLGRVLANEGAWVEAEAVFRRALEAQEARSGPDHPQVGVLLVRVGQALAGQGRTKEAVAAFERALEIHRATVGPDHPRVADALESLANVHEAENPALAETLHYEMIAGLDRRLGPNHPQTGEAHMRRGERLLFLHRTEAAFEEYSIAYAIFQETLPPTHAHLHRLRVARAQAKYEGGYVEAADSLLRLASERFQEGGASRASVSLYDTLRARIDGGVPPGSNPSTQRR